MHRHGALAHCWSAADALSHGQRVTPRPEGELAGDPTGLHPVCVWANGLPFMVLSDSARGSAPPGCRWVAQLQVPLDWLLSFLNEITGNLVRRLTLESFLRKGRGMSSPGCTEQ